jgi:hypothetical protein
VNTVILTKVKFTPQKRENAKIDFRVVNFMKFLEREIFAFSRFRVLALRVQLHNAKNLCLSYKTIKIKIKIYNQISFIKISIIFSMLLMSSSYFSKLNGCIPPFSPHLFKITTSNVVFFTVSKKAAKSH